MLTSTFTSLIVNLSNSPYEISPKLIHVTKYTAVDNEKAKYDQSRIAETTEVAI